MNPIFSASSVWTSLAGISGQTVSIPAPNHVAHMLRAAVAATPIPALDEALAPHFQLLALAEEAELLDRPGIYAEVSDTARTLATILSHRDHGVRISALLNNDRVNEWIRRLNAKQQVYPSAHKDAEGTNGHGGWGPYGIPLRDYQRGQIQQIVETIDAKKDRGVLRAPTQTGKTMIIGPLVQRTAGRFPNKMALVISPARVITHQIIDDLRLTAPALRVGIFDANRKDMDGEYDIIVASAYTLAREAHLGKFLPDFFGLVVIDEATYALAATWRKILKHFGFLDFRGAIQNVEGRFLLGLTADPFSLKAIFGEGNIIRSFGIHWFMQHGYLHQITGIQERYDPTLETELVEQAEELYSVPTLEAIRKLAVLNVYRKHLEGEKAMIFTSTIAHAKAHEEVFNEVYGVGYAKAIHNELSEAEIMAAIKGYNDGTGPKILISINMLSFGFRARGTRGIIHDYQTSSIRRYGQRIGRALGVMEMEAQRAIKNIDVIGREGIRDYLVTLARFLGIADLVEDGIEYHPFSLKRKPGQESARSRIIVPEWLKGLTFRFATTQAELDFPLGRFQTRLNQILTDYFHHDFFAMADALQINIETLNRYLYGAYPQEVEVVKELSAKLQQDVEAWVKDWELDMMDALEFAKPMKPNYSERIKAFLSVCRLEAIRLGALIDVSKGIPKTIKSARERERYETIVSKILRGEFPIEKEEVGSQRWNRLVLWLKEVVGLEEEKANILLQQLLEELYPVAEPEPERVPKPELPPESESAPALNLEPETIVAPEPVITVTPVIAPEPIVVPETVVAPESVIVPEPDQVLMTAQPKPVIELLPPLGIPPPEENPGTRILITREPRPRRTRTHPNWTSFVQLNPVSQFFHHLVGRVRNWWASFRRS